MEMQLNSTPDCIMVPDGYGKSFGNYKDSSCSMFLTTVNHYVDLGGITSRMHRTLIRLIGSKIGIFAALEPMLYIVILLFPL